jgi:hypothetical protein
VTAHVQAQADTTPPVSPPNERSGAAPDRARCRVGRAVDGPQAPHRVPLARALINPAARRNARRGPRRRREATSTAWRARTSASSRPPRSRSGRRRLRAPRPWARGQTLGAAPGERASGDRLEAGCVVDPAGKVRVVDRRLEGLRYLGDQAISDAVEEHVHARSSATTTSASRSSTSTRATTGATVPRRDLLPAYDRGVQDLLPFRSGHGLDEPWRSILRPGRDGATRVELLHGHGSRLEVGVSASADIGPASTSWACGCRTSGASRRSA